jgi:hypothetical protein
MTKQLNYGTKQFSTLLGTSPVGDELYSPYETYIKTLYELI